MSDDLTNDELDALADHFRTNVYAAGPTVLRVIEALRKAEKHKAEDSAEVTHLYSLLDREQKETRRLRERIAELEVERDKWHQHATRLEIENAKVKVERDERVAFAAAETEHANRWSRRAHTAEEACKRLLCHLPSRHPDAAQEQDIVFAREALEVKP